MLSEKMGIDDIDCKIMTLIQKEPNLSHSQIAEHVNRSQPTIGMRIKKLEKLGVLKYQAGITLKNNNLCFARVDIQTKNPLESFETVKNCPFLLNAFRLSGNMNISILAVGLNYNDLDQIINFHFRNNPDILKINTEIINDVVGDLILPFNLNFEQDEKSTICNENHK
ncbi:MAG: Lrp/AsnC family transcriptional regulator [Candidatus Lokiarchaeia archaeon]